MVAFHVRSVNIILLVVLTCAACGIPNSSQSDLDATIAAGVRATDTARQQEAAINSTIEAGVQATQTAQTQAAALLLRAPRLPSNRPSFCQQRRQLYRLLLLLPPVFQSRQRLPLSSLLATPSCNDYQYSACV